MKLDDEEHRSRREGEMSPGLRAMVADLRAEQPPELPWDLIEARLLRRIERGEGAELPPKSGSALWQLAPICAAAAAIALFVQMNAGSGEQRATAQPEGRVVDVSEIALAPVTTFARGDRDMSALRAGDVIETSGAPVSFARAGVARWTLAGTGTAIEVNDRIAGDPRIAKLNDYGHSFFDLPVARAVLVLLFFFVAFLALARILVAPRAAAT